jgi:hypothetical protein
LGVAEFSRAATIIPEKAARTPTLTNVRNTWSSSLTRVSLHGADGSCALSLQDQTDPALP